MNNHNTGNALLQAQPKDTNISQNSDREITSNDIVNEVQAFSNEDSTPLINGYQLSIMQATERKYLLNGLIPQVGLFALVGSSDAGKSTILRQLAISIATGTPFLNRLPIWGKALVVTTEDDPDGILFSYKRQTANSDREQLKNIDFLFAPEDALNEVTELQKNNQYNLIILDAWGDVLKADPKDNGRVRQALNDWHTLAVRHNVAIGILHHTGKRTEKAAPDKAAVIGAQSFEAKMRLVLELREDVESPQHRWLSILKGNYLASHEKTDAIRLFFNENFLFEFTGETKPKELLAQVEDPLRAKYDKAIELHTAGKTYEQIAAELGYKNKTSVSSLIAKHRTAS